MEERRKLITPFRYKHRQPPKYILTDTLTVEQLTQDSLILKKGELVLRYSKTNEIPDEEAIPTPDTPTQKLLSVKGKLIIGHETRSFTSEGDSTDYWIVDKTGELLQKYDGETKGIKNGTPVYVELEVIDMGKSDEALPPIMPVFIMS